MGTIHITFSQAHRTFEHPYSIHTISQVGFIAQIAIQSDISTEQGAILINTWCLPKSINNHLIQIHYGSITNHAYHGTEPIEIKLG